ncbi:hypothetical protein ACFYPK_07475 [Streptomyces halstedii]|uniref:hypothetical protein n=1 Tax=Streptomyces halstedii TaxID=1944 RepID=UPI0036A172FF
MFDPDAPVPPCSREGCNLPRAVRRGRHEKRLAATCSHACRIWLDRAQRATRSGDGEEAERLVQLARLLDARKNSQQTVPGIFVTERRTA